MPAISLPVYLTASFFVPFEQIISDVTRGPQFKSGKLFSCFATDLPTPNCFKNFSCSASAFLSFLDLFFALVRLPLP